MGMYRRLFYGPYMRIWLPEEEIEKSEKSCTKEECPKHKQYTNTNFCATCGSRVEVIRWKEASQINLHEFLEEELGNEDMFIPVYPDDVDYIIAVPNIVSTQGGFYFDDESKTEIMNMGNEVDPNWEWFGKPDWVNLSEALANKDIKFENFVGVLQWFS